MQNPGGLPSASTTIADALNALWAIVGDGPAGRSDPEGLQRLIDRFLDQRPANSVGELEHRLLTLASALDELGPWAADSEVLSHAERVSWQLN